MRSAAGMAFSLVGLILVGLAIASALHELIGLYQGTLNDPLASSEGGEGAVGERMLDALLLGLVGVPFLLLGSVLVIRARFRLRRSRRR